MHLIINILTIKFEIEQSTTGREKGISPKTY